MFPLISFSYASRVIGPEGFGKVQFILVFAQYFVLLAAIGIPTYGVREVAKIKNNGQGLKHLVSELLLLNSISSLLLFGVYFLLIFLHPYFAIDRQLYLLGGLIVLTGFSGLDWYYNGVEEFRFLSFRSISVKLLALLALFLFVKTKNDLVVYFAISVGAIFLNNLWNLWGVRKQITYNKNGLQFKRHLPALFTLLGTSISISIYSVIDVLLLGFLSNNTAVGYYTAALKLNKIAIPVVTVLGTVLIPRITHYLQKGDKHELNKLINQSFAFICLIGIPISFGLFLFSREFIISISGAEFEAATPSMQITAPLALIIAFAHLLSFQLLIPAGFERKYLKATLVGVSLSIALNLLLIQYLQDRGAAIATLMSEIAVTLFSAYFVWKHIQIKLNWRLAINALLASLIFFPIAWVLREHVTHALIRLLIAIPATACIYFLIQGALFKEPLMQEGIVFLKEKIKIGVNQ